ncbi:MAG TPA: hypothetical protein VEC06_05950 [Paucimonas sp.]|nr:hypothetical protein [Paucimonas sp.]
MMIARGETSGRESLDDFSRMLPHESWIAGRFGLTRPAGIDDSPPAAAAIMRGLGLEAETGHWFVLHPVHIHIARDHLVLTDIRQLALSDMESRLLFDDALPLFREAGLDARYGDPYTWFLRADDWRELRTATPDAAGGHNIDIWMPKGEGERAWRKVQNEVQMQWHVHAVNAAREAAGKRVVNSLWLWGGTSAGTAVAAAPYQHALDLPGWMGALGRTCPRHADDGDANAVLASPGEHIVAGTERLVQPAFAQDWGEWLARMHALEVDWFAPLLDALKAGKIDHLRLILSHNTGLVEFSIGRLGLRKFWIGPSLKRLTQ